MAAALTRCSARVDRFEHAVGQIVHQRDQEVAAAHGRVADFEFEQLAWPGSSWLSSRRSHR